MHRMAIVALSLLFGGCSQFLAYKVNKALPPVDPSAEKAAAIDDAFNGLHDLTAPDLYLDLAAPLLNTTVAEQLVKETPDLDSVEFALAEQEVRVRVRFHGNFNVSNIPGKYTASGTIYAFPRIVGNVLMFRPMADADLRVHSVTLRGKKPPDWITKFINEVLKTYVNNLNGLVAQQRVPLQVRYLQDFKSSDLFASLGPISVDERVVHFEADLRASSVLVDDQGVHGLASIEIAATPQAVPAGATYPQLLERFTQLSQVIDADLRPGRPEWGLSAVAVGKPFLGAALSETLGAALPVCAQVALSQDVTYGFNEVLKTDPAPDLNCEVNVGGRSCSQNRSCDQHRDCNPGWGCPDCNWWDPGSCLRRAGCEADKVRYRTQCEVEKTAARAACEAEKEAARIGCEIEKAGQLAGCRLNQAWLNTWGEVEVARLEGEGKLTNGSGRICVERVAADSLLSSLDLTTTISARADLAADFRFTPLNEGHIACVAPFTGTLSATALVPPQTFDVEGRLAPKSFDELSLEASFPDQLHLTIVPPPLLALPLQNPQVLLFCPVAVHGAVLGAGLSARAREDLIRSDFPQSLPPLRTAFKLPEQQLLLGGQSIRFTPAWRPASVMWVATTP